MKRLSLLLVSCSLVLFLSLFVFSKGTAFASDGGIHHSTRGQTVATPLFSGSCSGDGCDGIWVGNTNCGNSTKLLQDSPIIEAGTSTQIGSIRFWYSNTCGTNWTQAWSILDCSQVSDIFTEVDRNSGPDGGAIGVGQDGIFGGCSNTSGMVYAPDNTAFGFADISLTNGGDGSQTTNTF